MFLISTDTACQPGLKACGASLCLPYAERLDAEAAEFSLVHSAECISCASIVLTVDGFKQRV